MNNTGSAVVPRHCYKIGYTKGCLDDHRTPLVMFNIRTGSLLSLFYGYYLEQFFVVRDFDAFHGIFWIFLYEIVTGGIDRYILAIVDEIFRDH
ncbi:hypothetical protein, partial [Sphingobacterium siyangense]|uniref:hypothetical protein n=1 Tax=Sphingobacterium siyangense TaxID=459529 RepID=UPI003DA381A5